MSHKLDWPRYTRWTWILALLALLALIWMWMNGKGPSDACCAAPNASNAASTAASTAATSAAAVTAAATSTAAPAAMATDLEHKAVWDGNKLTLEGVVADEVTKKAILDAAKAKYGANNVIDKLTVDAAAKGRGIKVTLTGDVDSEAVKAAKGAEAQALYANARIDNQLKVAAAMAASATAPAKATDAQCTEKMAVAANFATGSARLTPSSAKLLSAVVPCITGPYEIGGHTDNVGQAAANQKLSERRAKTVAGFLASKGVDAKLLSTKGYGDTAPIADNATAEGKAKNRRIEFKKM